MNLTSFLDLAAQITISEHSTISRTIYQDPSVKAVLFGFDAGQELSEHTAGTPAIIHIVQGSAHMTLGEESLSAQANTWIHMPARTPHSIRAETPVVMLLLLLKGGQAE